MSRLCHQLLKIWGTLPQGREKERRKEKFVNNGGVCECKSLLFENPDDPNCLDEGFHLVPLSSKGSMGLGGALVLAAWGLHSHFF